MPFTLLDGVLLIVILISAVLAMIRGFTREVFSIGSWIAAAAVAYFFWDDLLPYVQRYVEDEKIALGVSIAGIFFVTLLFVSIITMRISDFVLDSRAGPIDRTLGFIFGAARGLLLVVIAVLFLDFFIPNDQPGWIAEAKSKPWLTDLGNGLINKLPEDPEGEFMKRVRDATGQGGTPAPGDDVVQEPTPETETPGPGAAPAPPSADDLFPPVDDLPPPTAEPGIAPDDQNQLERELEAPPPN